jgi:hypothetical protein
MRRRLLTVLLVAWIALFALALLGTGVYLTVEGVLSVARGDQAGTLVGALLWWGVLAFILLGLPRLKRRYGWELDADDSSAGD